MTLRYYEIFDQNAQRRPSCQCPPIACFRNSQGQNHEYQPATRRRTVAATKNALYRLRHRVEKITCNRASRSRNSSAHTPCATTMGRAARPGGRSHVDAPPPQLRTGTDIRVALQAPVAFLHRAQLCIQNPQPTLPPLVGRGRPRLNHIENIIRLIELNHVNPQPF